MDLKNKKVVFLGDSITEGAGASSKNSYYVNRFAETTGADVRNYGIGGTRIARKKVASENPRYDLDFCSRVEQLDSDADIVVVFGGTNDFDHGDAPLGNSEDRDVWSFYGACHVLFSSLVAKYPNKTIVIMTPLHRLAELDKSPNLHAFVQAEREVAEFYALPVLDLFKSSGIQPLVPAQHTLYFKDEVHPNDAGHEKIAYMLRRFLENM